MADVIFSEPSEYDMIDIEYYITNDLSNPQAAIRIIDGITDTIDNLHTFPEVSPIVSDELLCNLGIRIIHFDNYSVFYIYIESRDVVYIMRVLYSKADWKNILLGYRK
jgi:plasmid stabilization system protein ParE